MHMPECMHMHRYLLGGIGCWGGMTVFSIFGHVLGEYKQQSSRDFVLFTIN